jgi:hypothetical protein
MASTKTKGACMDMQKFYEIAHQAEYVRRQLGRLGIKLTYDGEVSFDIPEYVVEAALKDNCDVFFPSQLSFVNKVLLAIICTQEERNGHVDDSEIDFVNKFFKLNINRDKIHKMHKYL